jgi:lipoyl(octanoyl) transferase
VARFVWIEGAAPYLEVHALQQALVAARAADRLEDVVLLLEHPATITVGRRGREDAVIAADGVPVVAVERGGEATWHGPGQLVAYPIVSRRGRLDLHAHLRALEAAVIEVLARLGVEGKRDPRNSGVWVGDPARKVCSVGISVRQEVTWHGLALNLSPDLGEFARIRPCGFGAEIMTSLAAEGVDVSMSWAVDALANALGETLNLDRSPTERRSVAALVAELEPAPASGWTAPGALG